MDEKKRKAAIAGVMAFLSQEAASVRTPWTPPQPSLSPWTMQGVQTIMHNRAALQQGSIKR